MEETPSKTNDDSSPLAISQTWAPGQPRCSWLRINLPKNNENSSWLCWQTLLVISCCLASSGSFPTITAADEVGDPSKSFSSPLRAPLSSHQRVASYPQLKRNETIEVQSQVKKYFGVVDFFFPFPDVWIQSPCKIHILMSLNLKEEEKKSALHLHHIEFLGNCELEFRFLLIFQLTSWKVSGIIH